MMVMSRIFSAQKEKVSVEITWITETVKLTEDYGQPVNASSARL